MIVVVVRYLIMAAGQANKKLAKLITYILGHAPGEFGLVTDAKGFVKTKEFIKAVNEEAGWGHVRPALLNELRLTLPQIPFEIRDDRIRATDRQKLAAQRPADDLPPLLYTCIRGKALAHILDKGVLPTHHVQVILAADRNMAERIGRRRDAAPATLTVQTEDAAAQGVVFFQAAPPLFTADFIPPGCFTGPSLPRERTPAGKPAKKTAASAKKEPDHAAGSFAMKVKEPAGAAGQKKKTGRGPSWKKDRKKIRRNKQQGWPDLDD